MPVRFLSQFATELRLPQVGRNGRKSSIRTGSQFAVLELLLRVSAHNCKLPHSFICSGAMSGLESNSGSSGVFPAAMPGAAVCR